ncbi:hypothetical protein [Luteimonas sp. MC1895]|uniref:hypothetical protein n=1 Tax=Luteimonas sp. MC1895 TaxID=2819513 RepID=UPI0018F0B353|nr:hypothetical protein [Luteimonas sp. MC1895]MBJ6978431.1 hypothetical protein [Luteimonas sp. MC1895]
MQATHGFPHVVHWDSFQLADAVPRRLSELYHFELDRDDASIASPANGDAHRARAPRPYLPSSSLPARFQVD